LSSGEGQGDGEPMRCHLRTPSELLRQVYSVSISELVEAGLFFSSLGTSVLLSQQFDMSAAAEQSRLFEGESKRAEDERFVVMWCDLSTSYW